MNNTIKTLALSVTLLSGAGMAYAADGDTNVEVNSGLQATLDSISQQVENGSALNLAVNTADVDASVNLDATATATREAADAVSSTTGDIETTAMGAANTGSISIEQGNFNKVVSNVSDETYNYDFSEATSAMNNSETLEELTEVADTSDVSETVSSSLSTNYSEEINQTLSNYSVANIAYNAGAVNASVNVLTGGTESSINNSIKTTAMGAVNTGSITVTVK
ncbi:MULTISPECIES: hypothetical protein [unclassified Acinetobacter]|uniref:hypothetical protein n=1 Tax=unclassified Acinetobacter TaxID=196816 RepID=UPI001C226996